jgi:hypothetical protein
MKLRWGNVRKWHAEDAIKISVPAVQSALKVTSMTISYATNRQGWVWYTYSDCTQDTDRLEVVPVFCF